MSFDFNNVPDGLVAVVVANPTSALYSNEFSRYSTAQSDLSAVGVHVIFVTDDTQTDRLKKLDIFSGQSKIPHSIVYLEKKGVELKYLTHKEDPESDGNWTEATRQFGVNYTDTQVDDKNLWKWGQVVQEDGDYLCVDCGYIGEFKKGEVFPICEVCLSGDPAGPSGPEAGYWERV
jgi:hypothetical protein